MYDQTPDESTKKPPKPWWFKLLLALSPVLLILVVSLLYDAAARGRLDRAVTEARELGPLTLAELERERRDWPDDQNGALVITSLAPRFEELSKSLRDSELPVLGWQHGPQVENHPVTVDAADHRRDAASQPVG